MDRDTKAFDPADPREDAASTPAAAPPASLSTGPRPVEAPPGGVRRLLAKPRWRRLLMWGVPFAVVVIGGYIYITGGRFVSTDDAYVKSGIVTVSADVAGRVTAIAVRENQNVRRGDVLFRLDDRPYRFALDRAQGNLAQTRMQIDMLHANYRQKQAELKGAQDTLAFQQRQFERSKALVATRAVSQATFDAAQNAMRVAEQNVVSIEQQIASILASLGGRPDSATEEHPMVRQAAAQVDQAALDLERAVIHAPVDGVVSKVETLQVGQYLSIGTPAFALVSARVWVEANFKETELTHMRPGNAATVTFDTYSGRRFEARIESIGAATGAEFSVLPPQNATGNWVKVTQRLPVRVVIVNPDPALPLRAGMSVTVEVDTAYRRPALALIEGAFAGSARSK